MTAAVTPVQATEPGNKDLIVRLISELASMTRADRGLAIRKAFQAVQLAQERRNRAEKQYMISLKLLRRIVGGPTFALDGQKYQIRVRDGRPFICIMDDNGRTLAAAAA